MVPSFSEQPAHVRILWWDGRSVQLSFPVPGNTSAATKAEAWSKAQANHLQEVQGIEEELRRTQDARAFFSSASYTALQTERGPTQQTVRRRPTGGGR